MGVAQVVDQVESSILDAVLGRAEPLVIIDSPPGAGKTGLVETISALAVTLGLSVLVVTPKAEQGFALCERLADHYPGTPLQILHAKDRHIPACVRAAGIATTDQAAALRAGAGVTVTTASKAMYASEHLAVLGIGLLVVDEAYQLTWSEFAPLAHLAQQCVLVGDPGQLPPIVTADTARFEAAETKVHWPAPRQLLRSYPEVVPHRLPASRRLPSDTADIISSTFYGDMPFVSAAPPRGVRLVARGLGTPVDRALEAIAAGRTLIALILPRTMLEHDLTDPELAALAAEVGVRALQRGIGWCGPSGQESWRPLASADLGFIDPHVASGAEMRRQVRAAGINHEAKVDTPEIWQGLERPLTIVKHPLSGTSELGDFELQPGRLCVMTTRHQLGCIIVSRDGVADQLTTHVQDTSRRPSGSVDHTWLGHQANSSLWSRLEADGRVFRM